MSINQFTRPTPENTVWILTELVSKGLSEQLFSNLHHFDDDITIKAHLHYCDNHPGTFRVDGSNARTHIKLFSLLLGCTP